MLLRGTAKVGFGDAGVETIASDGEAVGLFDLQLVFDRFCALQSNELPRVVALVASAR